MEFHLEADESDDGIYDDEQDEVEVDTIYEPCELELRLKSDLVLLCSC